MKWKISKKPLTCEKCGHTLSNDEVRSVKAGVPTSCHRCGHTIIVDRHLKSQEQDDREDDGGLVHPVGRLSIGHKVQPLDVDIQKFGDVRDENEDESRDYFAPAAFQDMSDSERLDAPSFEKVCPYCGHKNRSGSSVCETCGASI